MSKTSSRLSDRALVGDLEILFGHGVADDEVGKEPLMYLRNPRSHKVVGFPLSKAYLFSPLGDINPNPLEAQQCFNRINQYAAILYGQESGTGVRSVAEAIASRLDDLIMMPPHVNRMSESEFQEFMDRNKVVVKADGERVN